MRKTNYCYCLMFIYSLSGCMLKTTDYRSYDPDCKTIATRTRLVSEPVDFKKVCTGDASICTAGLLITSAIALSSYVVSPLSAAYSNTKSWLTKAECHTPLNSDDKLGSTTISPSKTDL